MHTDSSRSKAPPTGFLVLLVAVASTCIAQAAEFELALDVPKLETLDASLPNGGGDPVQISLQLAFDEKGKLVCGGACAVDGVPVSVKGTLKSKNGVATYKLGLKGDGVGVKLSGDLADGETTALFKYKGPRGKIGPVEEIVQLSAPTVVATITAMPVLDQFGKITGTGVFSSGYGNDMSTEVVLKGKLKNGTLVFTLKAGKQKLSFKGVFSSDDTFTGTAKFALPPAKGSIDDFDVVDFLVPPDSVKPTIALTSPADDAVVNDVVAVSALAGDNVGVFGVQFLLDGANLGAEDLVAPYSIQWDTNGTANGPHVLSGIVRDAAGNTARAGSIIVQVANFDPAVIDADLAALEPTEWYEVPNSKVAFVQFPNPSNNLRPGLFNQIIEKCGAALDTKRNRYVVWGGGSDQYFGNELYAFDLAKYRWSRLNDPYPTPEDNPDSFVHSDGSPIARQSWDAINYLPDPVDRLIVGGGGGKWPGGACCYWDWNTYAFDFDAGSWSLLAPMTLSYGQGAVSAVAPDGRLWQHGVQTTTNYLSVYDPTANEWTEHAQFPGWFDFGGAADIDPVRNEFVWTGVAGTWAWDLDDPDGGPVQLATTGDDEVEAFRCGFVYHPPSDTFVAWAGGPSVYVLDPETAVWTKVDTTGTLNPGGQASNGTLSRWQWVPSKDLFMVVSSVNGDVFFYRPPAAGEGGA